MGDGYILGGQLYNDQSLYLNLQFKVLNFLKSIKK